MLILTRFKHQSVIIGDQDVVITVLGLNNKSVSLGFEASKDISIHRDEIFNRIKQKENEKQEVEKIINTLEKK